MQLLLHPSDAFLGFPKLYAWHFLLMWVASHCELDFRFPHDDVDDGCCHYCCHCEMRWFAEGRFSTMEALPSNTQGWMHWSRNSKNAGSTSQSDASCLSKLPEWWIFMDYFNNIAAYTFQNLQNVHVALSCILGPEGQILFDHYRRLGWHMYCCVLVNCVLNTFQSF